MSPVKVKSVCWYSPVLLWYKNEKQLNWCWYIGDHHRLVCVCHLWELVTNLDQMLEVHVDGMDWLSTVFLISWLAYWGQLGESDFSLAGVQYEALVLGTTVWKRSFRSRRLAYLSQLHLYWEAFGRESCW